MLSKNTFLIIMFFSLFLLSSCRTSNSDLSYYSNNAYGGSGSCHNCCNTCGSSGSGSTKTCSSVLTVATQYEVPVEGAFVTVYHNGSQVHITDANGEVDLTGLQDGYYVVKVIAAGYPTVIDTFTVAGGVCPTLSITLIGAAVPTCDALFKIVGDALGYSSPVEGAILNINGQDYPSDVSGNVTITGLTDGSYPYTVTANGYPISSGVYIVSDLNCPATQVLLLVVVPSEPTCDFLLAVYASVGGYIQGAAVVVNGITYYTGSNGIATIPGLVAGYYSYTVTAAGYEPVSSGFTVSDLQYCRALVPVTNCQPVFTVNSESIVNGFSVIAPVVGAEISINGNTYVTDANGQATIASGLLMNPGVYSYSVTAAGYDTYAWHYDVVDAEQQYCKDVEITLSAAITTCDANFSIPITGGIISTVHINGQTYNTNSQGKATVTGLQNGSYPYTVTVAGYPAYTYSGTYVVNNLVCPEVLICPVIFEIQNYKFVPQAGASLNIKRYGQVGLITNANGRVTVGLLSVGSYPYTAASGFSGETGSGTYVISGSTCPTNPYVVVLHP